MGRRSVRKIPETLDLSRHYFEWEGMSRPLPLDAMLPAGLPLEIEIGSGKGLFLFNASDKYPDHRFLGIELARKYARTAAARLARVQRPNAVVVQGHAMQVLQEGCTDQCAAAVHVYFPDPWWKKRHHKRRIINAEFLQQVGRVLQAGGRFVFWTDVREYFDLGLEAVAQSRLFSEPEFPPPDPAEHDLDYRTHFERRMRLQGLPVYRSEFTRRER